MKDVRRRRVGYDTTGFTFYYTPGKFPVADAGKLETFTEFGSVGTGISGSPRFALPMSLVVLS